LPVCALFLGGSIVLMTVGITERYLHDFYPALILCAAIGTAAFPFDRLRVVKLTVMAGLVVVSVWMNCGFAIVFQRAAPWGVPPDKRAEFVQWQRSVGQFFGYQQPE
jgi:hypothetical protein